MNYQPKLNVLGGVVTLGGDVVPAANTLTINNTMQTPYQNIGDANECSASITGADGHDKATLLRRTFNPNLPDIPVPSDGQWQSLIYLIDAAPRLLEVVLIVYPWLTVESDVNGHTMSEHDKWELDGLIRNMKIAIDLATKGAQ